MIIIIIVFQNLYFQAWLKTRKFPFGIQLQKTMVWQTLLQLDGLTLSTGSTIISLFRLFISIYL